jgi:hypothetical protein
MQHKIDNLPNANKVSENVTKLKCSYLGANSLRMDRREIW